MMVRNVAPLDRVVANTASMVTGSCPSTPVHGFDLVTVSPGRLRHGGPGEYLRSIDEVAAELDRWLAKGREYDNDRTGTWGGRGSGHGWRDCPVRESPCYTLKRNSVTSPSTNS